MRRSDWMAIFIPLLFTIFIDRVTKLWVTSNLEGVQDFGVLSFTLQQNHGAMLGLFSDLPKILRVVSLATSGAFLLFIYAILQFLLPIRSLTLRAGMSVLIGGILGNVTDRILFGYVIDFIMLGRPTPSTPVFNLADALQWVGYFLIVYALLKESHVLWPQSELRSQKWVNFKFQIRYCFLLMAAGLGFSLIAGIFSYTFLSITIADLVGQNSPIITHYLVPFTITFTFVSLMFSAILFFVGRVVSARIAGPLFAFEKFLDDLSKGHSRPLKLRANDEFKQLEIHAERLRDIYKTDRLKKVENE